MNRMRVIIQQTMVNLEKDIWHWHHNVSECFYHIQITVKYRKALLFLNVQQVILDTLKNYKQRYDTDISEIGFDQDHLHILCQFLPKYSGGKVIKLIKSMTAQKIFKNLPEVKKELWGGEFWTDGYYIATISNKGNKETIAKYIRNQGREKDIRQLQLFNI